MEFLSFQPLKVKVRVQRSQCARRCHHPESFHHWALEILLMPTLNQKVCVCVLQQRLQVMQNFTPLLADPISSKSSTPETCIWDLPQGGPQEKFLFSSIHIIGVIMNYVMLHLEFHWFQVQVFFRLSWTDSRCWDCKMTVIEWKAPFDSLFIFTAASSSLFIQDVADKPPVTQWWQSCSVVFICYILNALRRPSCGGQENTIEKVRVLYLMTAKLWLIV